LRVAAEVNGVHYSNFRVSEKWDYVHNFVLTDYTNVSGSAGKLYALVENCEQIGFVKANLPKELRLNVSRDGMAMVMHREATKSNAILAIAQEFHISKNDIVAFGDDINDQEMFLTCGLSVAMNNAIDEIKEMADDICDSNDSDGVAKYLEKRICLTV
jgi:HAD superfamily hydrolase (TIGR01484 family)